MHAHQSLLKNESLGTRHLSSPAELPRPPWLKEGDYESPTWVVVDDHPSSPRPPMRIRWDVQLFDPRRANEVCRLTDPEYSNLLDTIKRQSFSLRVGRFATCAAGVVHGDMSRQIINWALWMIRNSIYAFADLDQDDFDSYVQAARYGSSFLIGYRERLVEYVSELKRANLELPTVKRAGMPPALDIWRLLSDAGLDRHKARVDKLTSYELAKLSYEAGLYLTKLQKKRLSKKSPVPVQVCSIPLLLLLQPWDNQWHMRDYLPGDRVTFDPFQDSSATEMSENLGTKISRTKTAPVKQTMELIDMSIRWVLDYAPTLLDMRDAYLEIVGKYLSKERRLALMAERLAGVPIPDGPGQPFPLTASMKKSRSGGLEVGVAINRFLPTACAVVISAFTARRHEEVLTLRAAGPNNDHCISRDENGLWLEAFIEKSRQDWVKSPCNELVEKAVDILERWSRPARTSTGKPGMFQLRRILRLPIVRFYLGYSLNEFVDFLHLSPLADGKSWRFTPHQFRRFFAIMYYWRYEYGNLAALSHQLFHSDPGMTLKYVTERDIGAIFKEVGTEHTATLLMETAVGERNLSGPYGERFKTTAIKLYHRYKRLTKVVAPRMVSKVIERYVQRSSIRLKAMPWGYCTCGTRPHQVAKARCVSKISKLNSSGPDFSGSSPATCCDCPHHATDRVFEPFLLTQIEFHGRAAADPKNGPMVRATSREHATKLRAHHKRTFLNSKPLELPND
jgi:hypothetical protein